MSHCPVVAGGGEAKIERENHNVRAIVILEGTPTTTTRDLRCDRVWVWVNRNGIVTDAPQVG
ncbi:hypothetical protein ACE6H2_028412 [Prunus campanulata]